MEWQRDRKLEGGAGSEDVAPMGVRDSLEARLERGFFIPYWQCKAFLVLGKGIYTQCPSPCLGHLPANTKIWLLIQTYLIQEIPVSQTQHPVCLPLDVGYSFIINT